jgi:hypothetical protein
MHNSGCNAGGFAGDIGGILGGVLGAGMGCAGELRREIVCSREIDGPEQKSNKKRYDKCHLDQAGGLIGAKQIDRQSRRHVLFPSYSIRIEVPLIGDPPGREE